MKSGEAQASKENKILATKSFLNVERRWELIIQSLSEIKINVLAEKNLTVQNATQVKQSSKKRRLTRKN